MNRLVRYRARFGAALNGRLDGELWTIAKSGPFTVDEALDIATRYGVHVVLSLPDKPNCAIFVYDRRGELSDVRTVLEECEAIRTILATDT